MNVIHISNVNFYIDKVFISFWMLWCNVKTFINILHQKDGLCHEVENNSVIQPIMNIKF